MAWTDKMISELRKLWKNGVTTGEIGKRLGISKNSVVGKVHRLGLDGRPSPIKLKKAPAKKVIAKPAPKKAPAKKVIAKPAPKKAPAKKVVTKPTPKKAPAKKVVVKPAPKKAPAKKVVAKPVPKKAPAKKVVAKPAPKKAPAKKVVAKPAPKPAPVKKAAPAPKPASKAAPIAQAKAKSGKITKLTDLDNHTCRWPLGDPKDDNFQFCGKKVKIGQTYCDEHSAVAYVKAGKK